jgi:RDD family protein
MFCSTCGSALNAGSSFCARCGSRSASAAVPPANPSTLQPLPGLTPPPTGLPSLHAGSAVPPPSYANRGGAPGAAFQPHPQPFPAPARAAPPVVLREEEGLGIDCPIARPWPRFWARSVDLGLGVCICSLLLGTVMGPLMLAGMQNPILQVFFGSLLLAVALCLDAACYAGCGNTPGKWLVGIQVLEASGRPLTFVEYLYRNMGVMLRGLALGAPFVNWLTLIYCYRKSNRGELLDWDAKRNSRPFRVRSDPWRLYAGVGALFVIAILFTLPYLIPAIRNAMANTNQIGAGLGLPGGANAAMANAAASGTADYLAKPVDPKLQRIIDESNRGLPQDIGTDARMEKVEGRGPDMMIYNYTLKAVSLAGMPPQRVDDTRRELLTNLEAGAREAWHKACTSSDSDNREMVSVVSKVFFAYKDRDGKDIGYVSTDCAESAAAH